MYTSVASNLCITKITAKHIQIDTTKLLGKHKGWLTDIHAEFELQTQLEQRKYEIWLTGIHATRQLLASAIVWKALIPTNPLEN
jgi:hypothetical protein